MTYAAGTYGAVPYAAVAPAATTPSPPPSGDLTGVLPGVTAELTGTYTQPGILAGVLPAVAGDLAGDYTPPDPSGHLAGTLPRVLASLQGAYIRSYQLTPSESGVSGPVGVWDLPPEMIVTILDPEIEQSPGILVVQVSMVPAGNVEFSIAGTTVATATADETGVVGPLTIEVPESLGVGTHELLITAGTATASDEFTVLNSPAILPEASAPDANPVTIPGATGRWVLQDLMPGGLGSWALTPGPSSYQPIPTERNLQAVETTYSGGKKHVAEGRTYAAPWSFAGYCPDRAYYDKLVAYGALRRRIYVIDHRGRAWTCVPLGPDLVPRKRQMNDDGTFNDWAHDYTMRFLLYGTDFKTLEA